MRSVRPGRSTSGVEVTNVSGNGVWLLLDDQEVFLSFDHFPWFRDASIGQILDVRRPSPHHLYWPELDVDIAVESIAHPERYPLVSKARPKMRLKPAAAAVGKSRRG